MKKNKLRLGDIYEIPLPNGKNAYGRLYKEYVLAIYRNRYNSVNELPQIEEYEFFVGVYKDLLLDGEWKIVGNRKFDNEEDAWAPPQCVVDAITKKGALYYKGEIIPCTYEECKNLEIVAAWDRHHVVDRLTGNIEWMKYLDKPINLDNKHNL